MLFKGILCLVLVACAVSVRGDDDDDDDDVKEFIANYMTDYMKALQSFMDVSLSDLKHFVNSTFGSRLDRIEGLVESLEKRELFAEMCTPDVCGAHGTCDLADDWKDIVCHCEIGYRGSHCEFHAVCDAKLEKFRQSPIMLGAPRPLCSEDGLYAAVQYMGTDAYCATPYGYKIDDQYSVHVMHSEGMNCQCARDLDAAFRDNLSIEGFDCTSLGNYPPHVCDSTSCICQDSHGRPYGDPVPYGVEYTLDC